MRGQEQTAGKDVEADPDDQHGADHTEQTGVDLGGAEKALHRVFARAGLRGLRGIRDFGHAVPFSHF